MWALCPAGHFLQGFYRTEGHWLFNIEEGKCCKPAGLPNTYAKCVDKDIGLSFDNKGLSSCDDGYYMTGIYRGSCDKLYCIEKMRCCKMYESRYFTSILTFQITPVVNTIRILPSCDASYQMIYKRQSP